MCSLGLGSTIISLEWLNGAAIRFSSDASIPARAAETADDSWRHRSSMETFLPKDKAPINTNVVRYHVDYYDLKM